MAFNTKLADRLREYLAEIPGIDIEEKKMFSGMAFMVNGKMCVNVSGDNLMCRFDPALQEEVAGKKGYEPMIMKGRELEGYCYVNPEGFKTKKDFEYWIELCLDFNSKAKASKKTKTSKKATGSKKVKK
jgi:TfoX/Sxy family transcriptional regulator of competence genes